MTGSPGPVGPEAIDSARVLRVAMRTAVALLQSGAQSDEVETAVVTVASAYGVHGVQASVSFSSIAISHDASGLDHPTTLLHIVRDRGTDFVRLAGAAGIVRRIRDEHLGLDEAGAELEALDRQSSPFGPAITFVAPGISAAASTVVFAGNLADAAATLGIALIVQPALALLDRSTLPPFFRVAFGAAASTLLVALLVGLGAPITGGLVLTGSLLRFLPGYALVSGFRDLISQSVVSGTARLAEALLLGAGVAGGIALGVTVAGAFGINLSIITAGQADWDQTIVLGAAFLAVGAFAVRLGVPLRAVVQAALLGASAWFIFVFISAAGTRLDPSVATFVAATLIGFVARLLARRSHTPAALWIVPAILLLLPGLQIVQALLAVTDAARVAGLVAAATTAFVLGTGVATGDILLTTGRRLTTQVVVPAVDAVTGGVDGLLIAPVERAVGRVRPSRESESADGRASAEEGETEDRPG